MKKHLIPIYLLAAALMLSGAAVETAAYTGSGNRAAYETQPAVETTDATVTDTGREADDSSTDESAADVKKETPAKVYKPGWVKKSGKYFWRNEDGSILNKKGMVRLGDSWYFLNKDHSRFSKGFKTVKEKKYYFGKDGKRLTVTGFYDIGGKVYYFKKNGSIYNKPGFKKVNGTYYYFTKKGPIYRKPGFKKVNGNYYLFTEDGGLMMDTGFTKINGADYYFTSGHYIATGITEIDGSLYFFGKNGKLKKNQLPFEWEGKWYRTDSSGAAEKITEVQAEASRLTWVYINKNSSESDSNARKFRKCFNRMVWADFKPSYIARRDVIQSDGPYKAVIKVLRNTNRWTHNCYGFACVVASCAKELGYKPELIIMDDDHAVVRINGKYYDNMGARFGTDSTALKGWKTYKKFDF